MVLSLSFPSVSLLEIYSNSIIQTFFIRLSKLYFLKKLTNYIILVFFFAIFLQIKKNSSAALLTFILANSIFRCTFQTFYIYIFFTFYCHIVTITDQTPSNQHYYL